MESMLPSYGRLDLKQNKTKQNTCDYKHWFEMNHTYGLDAARRFPVGALWSGGSFFFLQQVPGVASPGDSSVYYHSRLNWVPGIQFWGKQRKGVRWVFILNFIDILIYVPYHSPFKVYNSVLFHIFAEPFDHHHNQF